MNTPFDSEIVLVTASTISNSDGQRLGFTALFLSNLAFQMANKSKWREIKNNYSFFRHTKYSWSSRPSLKADVCNSPESWLEIIFVVDGSVSKIKCSYTLDQCTGEICYFKGNSRSSSSQSRKAHASRKKCYRSPEFLGMKNNILNSRPREAFKNSYL